MIFSKHVIQLIALKDVAFKIYVEMQHNAEFCNKTMKNIVHK